MNFIDPAITGSTKKTIPVTTKNASRWRISGQSRQAHNATVIYVIKSPQLSSLVPVFEVTLNLRATNPSTASDSNETARIARKRFGRYCQAVTKKKRRGDYAKTAQEIWYVLIRCSHG